MVMSYEARDGWSLKNSVENMFYVFVAYSCSCVLGMGKGLF